MTDVVVVESDASDEPESAPVEVVAPVVTVEPGDEMLRQAETLGRVEAAVTDLTLRVMALEARTEAAEETADVALDVAIGATEVAATAVEVAEETPVMEMPPEPTPVEDEKPKRQHWLFRERGE